MARGGPREGAPGKAYTNRTDMNTALPATTGPSHVYGDSAKLERAQQAVPMAPPPQPNLQAVPDQRQAAPLPPMDLYAPSNRPGEPVTTGLPVGAGAGPEALGLGNTTRDQLAALYMAEPSEDLRELLELYDEGVY